MEPPEESADRPFVLNFGATKHEGVSSHIILNHPRTFGPDSREDLLSRVIHEV